jgi:threonine synthase
LRRIAAIAALVLANRTPPYALEGGVRTALQSTNGRTYAVTNPEIASAQRLFREHEHLAIGPEAGAALVQACGRG